MDNHVSPGSAQSVAALLRRSSDTLQEVHDPCGLAREAGKRNSDRSNPARPAQPARPAVHKPVLETSEFRVVEPDGTEDPGASADDGLVPNQDDGSGNPGKR